MKQHYKVVLITFILFLLAPVTDAPAETLRDAVKSVLQNNPEITAAAYNRLARDQEVKQARADFFPKIDSSLSAGYVNQDHPFRDHFWPRSATVRLSQNLFRGGATLSETNRQKSRVASEAYLIQGTSENIALLACKVYLNYLRALEQHDLAKENLLIHERFYDQIKLRSQAGVDRGVDLEQITARLALAKSNLVVTEANIENAKTDYQAVMGYLPVSPVKPAHFDSEIPATMQTAEKIALDNHPTLKSAQADIEARKYQHKTARALVYPSLDLGAEYTWGHDLNGPSAFYKYQDYFQVNAMIKFNIFNGFANEARIKETSYLINEAEEIAKKTKQQTIQSIRLSYESYMADQRRIKQLEQYVASTDAAAEAFILQWSIGRRTLFDVLDTSAEKITAKSDLINAQYDKMYSSFRILSGLGKLVHTLDLQWPEESRIENDKKKDSKPAQPVQAIQPAATPATETKPAMQKEAVIVPRATQPAASNKTVVAAAKPALAEKKTAPVNVQKPEAKILAKDDVKNFVNKWLAGWTSGDMKTYRNCYASDFESNGKNLDAWIAHKTNIFRKSKNINVRIDDLQISGKEGNAKAIFTQSYNSSIFKDSGQKTLELKKINDEWKIYREIM